MDDNAKQILKNMLPGTICAVVITACIFLAKISGEQNKQPVPLKKSIQAINTTNIDSQIQNAHKSVDSLRHILNQSDEKIWELNPLYTHKSVTHTKIDSLENLNEKLISQAYDAATKSSTFCVARKNETVFNEYANVPAVRRAHKQFKLNTKRIKNLQQQIQNINNNKNKTVSDVRGDIIDTIQQYQRQIDSLLNMKHIHIMQHIR